jgi:anthranilate/para-aminobenzoate synthase component I
LSFSKPPSYWMRFLWVFEQSTEETSLLLAGGQQDATELNEWLIAGFGVRQKIELKNDILTHEGPHGSFNLDLRRFPNFQEAHQVLFDRLEMARKQARYWQAEADVYQVPLSGGLAGSAAYSFYRWCDSEWYDPDSRFDRELEQASLILFEYKDWLLLNVKTGRFFAFSDNAIRKAHYEELWDMSQMYALPEEPLLKPYKSPRLVENPLQSFDCSLSQADFEDRVEKIRSCIQRGELYQANLSIRLTKTTSIDPWILFKRLCEKNPSAFSGYFRWSDGVIVSNSPERLVQVDHDGLAQTRPIAGTRGRGANAEEDAAIAETLLSNEKELAEHRMLVDLSRNDLGRVCEAGTVELDALLSIERYAHVTHLVSNVQGKLQSDKTPWDVLQALFPGGTITGCPKVRCVETLAQLEPVDRGFYTGSLGYVSAQGSSMDWNILIRSVFFQNLAPVSESSIVSRSSFLNGPEYQASIHIGAGIVQDAVAAHEYRECLRKATSSLEAFLELEREQAAYAALKTL